MFYCKLCVRRADAMPRVSLSLTPSLSLSLFFVSVKWEFQKLHRYAAPTRGWKGKQKKSQSLAVAGGFSSCRVAPHRGRRQTASGGVYTGPTESNLVVPPGWLSFIARRSRRLFPFTRPLS